MNNTTFKSCVPRKYMDTKKYLQRGFNPKAKTADGHLFKEICDNCGEAMGFHDLNNKCKMNETSLTKIESNDNV